MMDSPSLPNAVTPAAPPPMFGAVGGKKKPSAGGMSSTFLGSGLTPSPVQTGAKTLLGQ